MTADPPAVTVGVDFGTLSGRAPVVAVEDGRELGSAVREYTLGHGTCGSPSANRAARAASLRRPASCRQGRRPVDARGRVGGSLGFGSCRQRRSLPASEAAVAVTSIAPADVLNPLLMSQMAKVSSQANTGIAVSAPAPETCW